MRRCRDRQTRLAAGDGRGRARCAVADERLSVSGRARSRQSRFRKQQDREPERRVPGGGERPAQVGPPSRFQRRNGGTAAPTRTTVTTMRPAPSIWSSVDEAVDGTTARPSRPRRRRARAAPFLRGSRVEPNGWRTRRRAAPPRRRAVTWRAGVRAELDVESNDRLGVARTQEPQPAIFAESPPDASSDDGRTQRRPQDWARRTCPSV